MRKKENSPPPTEKIPVKKQQPVAIGLLIGDWKNEFPEHQCKVMIAEALNYCVYHEGMKIAGYLITKRRLCLVLIAAADHVNELLQAFYKELRKEILQRRHQRKEALNMFEKADITAAEKHTQLFIKYPLQNYMLIALITGQQVQLPYYSPHLERLKKKINAYNFCSAVDYTGAKSPVVVKLLKHEDPDQL